MATPTFLPENELVVHDAMHGEHVYRLPNGRDLNAAMHEAARLHPSWTRVDIVIRKGQVAHVGKL